MEKNATSHKYFYGDILCGKSPSISRDAMAVGFVKNIRQTPSGWVYTLTVCQDYRLGPDIEIHEDNVFTKMVPQNME